MDPQKRHLKKLKRLQNKRKEKLKGKKKADQKKSPQENKENDEIIVGNELVTDVEISEQSLPGNEVEDSADQQGNVIFSKSSQLFFLCYLHFIN